MHVLPQHVNAAWPWLQRSFRKGLDASLGDRMDEVAILESLCEGSRELIVAAEDGQIVGGLILEFVERPKGRCCILAAFLFNEFRGGNLPAWTLPMNAHLADYAKRIRKCYTVETYARDGIVRSAEKLGWRRKATVMEMV